MPDDPSFAPPLSELATSNLAPPSVTLDPSAGQGFSLDERASVPIAVQGGTWRMEFIEASVDIPNTAGGGGGSVNVTIPGLAIGDLCFLVGRDSLTGRGFAAYTESECVTADTVVVQFVNATATASDPAAINWHFLVIHRFL